MHTFPQLRKIERKYGDKVVVVGVHSPKFPAERETANLREAVLRYRIEHPVVNDRDFQVWQRFGGRAWPTLIFIDPEGPIRHGFGSGEPALLDGPAELAAFQQPQGMARAGTTLYVWPTPRTTPFGRSTSGPARSRQWRVMEHKDRRSAPAAVPARR